MVNISQQSNTKSKLIMKHSFSDQPIMGPFGQFANLMSETFIPLCIEASIKPTKKFIFESMLRGSIPAESILKKVIEKEVCEYSGDYLSKQQLRSEKFNNLQDTLSRFIKVIDQINKIGITMIWHKTRIGEWFNIQLVNTRNGTASINSEAEINCHKTLTDRFATEEQLPF